MDVGKTRRDAEQPADFWLDYGGHRRRTYVGQPWLVTSPRGRVPDAARRGEMGGAA